MRPRIFALALLLAAACDNRDEDFEREIRDICASLEIGTTTLLQGRQAFGDFEVFVDCRSDYEPLANQTCAEGPVCQLRWQFLSNSCGPGGCTLVCEVRTADVANGGPPPSSTTICARRFLDQQPFVLR